MLVTATVEFPNWDNEGAESAIIKKATAGILEAAQDRIVEQVREAVMAEIKAQASEIVKTAIETPVRRTNNYGEARGEPVSLRELIATSAQEWLEGPVDPKTGKPQRYGGDKAVSRAHYHTRIAVRREMAKTYQDAIDAAAQEAKYEMGDKVSEMVREAIARILKV